MNFALFLSPLWSLADIVVNPHPTPPPSSVPMHLAGSGWASGVFWGLAAVAVVMLWRLRRQRMNPGAPEAK